MNSIGAIMQQWRQSLLPRIRGTLVAGASPAVSGSSSFARRKKTFVADRRGAVAFETLLVYLVLATTVFLPLADMGVAVYQFLSAWGALRGFGEYLQYNTPPDPTSLSTWSVEAQLPMTVSGYKFTAANLQVMCGDTNTACNSGNVTSVPKYFSYSTTVTLSPMVPFVKLVLCPSSCQYTLSYTERFQ